MLRICTQSDGSHRLIHSIVGKIYHKMGASSSAMHSVKKQRGRQSLLPPPSEDGDGPSSETTSSIKTNNAASDNQQNTKEKKMDYSDIYGILKGLNLRDIDMKSVNKILTDNKDIHEVLLACAAVVKALISGNDADILLYLEKINFLFFEVELERRSILGDFLKHVHFCLYGYQIYQKWLKSLKMDHFREEQAPESDVSQMIYYVRSHWWNFSDCSAIFAMDLISQGIGQVMITDIKNMVNIDEKSLKYSFTFESAIGILHNSAKIEKHRQAFRDMKLVEILGNFLKYENLPKITMLVLLTLALVIDEDQTDLLFSHESSFDLLILLAKRAWKSKDLRYDGFSFEELIHGLEGLSKNDKVKRLVVEKGLLDLLSEVLGNGKEKEKEMAGKLIWQLSFDPVNRDLISKNEIIMGALNSMSKESTKSAAQCAQGALWVIKMEDKKKEAKSKSVASVINEDESTSSKGHIMISYNWSDQKQLIEIKDSLKSNGFTVWMDIENISGSTLQAMAEAVEGSVVVLVCMSEKYKESPNCRSEAEYAFSLNKPIIPLLMQERYKPDGWLGILLGTKLFFDFSGRYSFGSKISELMKELMGRGLSKNDEVDGPIVKTAVALVGKTPQNKKNISQLDLKKWIIENKLQNYPALQSMETDHLLFLKKLSLKAPEFFYNFLMNLIQGKATFEDLCSLMQVADAFDKISA